VHCGSKAAKVRCSHWSKHPLQLHHGLRPCRSSKRVYFELVVDTSDRTLALALALALALILTLALTLTLTMLSSSYPAHEHHSQ
jgi:hypothetical protein